MIPSIHRFALIFLSLIIIITPIGAKADAALTDKIYKKIAAQQIQATSYFEIANQSGEVQSWDKQSGLFASYIKMNFVGDDAASFMRNAFSIYDNNFFVTAWTLESLIQSQAFNAITIDPRLMQSAINAELTFNDKNRTDSALITFWPQQQNQSYWQASPSNLNKLLDNSSALTNTFMKICMKVESVSKCSDLFTPIQTSLSNFKDAFHIPADADDTSLNLSLGASLYMNRQNPVLNDAYQSWRNVYTDAKIKTALQDLMQYTYQPLSALTNHNVIDPRSYYVMHDYLEQNDQQNTALIPTWAFNLSDEQSEIASGFKAHLPIAMPFNVNNIDPTVESNFIYAVSTLDQAGLLDEILNSDTTLTSQLNQSLLSCTQYIIWVINNDVVEKRPDIAIVYYPAKYNIYLSASRIVKLYAQNPSHSPVLNNIANELTESLQKQATTSLLKDSQTQGDLTYWDDFLGDADHRTLSKSPLAEDRIYSTAVVVNTLLNIWTVPAHDAHLTWRNNTPAPVKVAVTQAINWLTQNILSNTYKKENVFFSGSVKGLNSLPFIYPGNLAQYIDGRPFAAQTLPMDNTVLIGMQGYVNPQNYQSMIAASHFGYATPTIFTGFNDKKAPFPFWSAPVLTYAFTLEAIAKYSNVLE